MALLKRSHYCGDLRAEHIGETVRLCGWVWHWRDHGGVVFIDLRDRTGHSQIVFNPDDSAGTHEDASALRSEFVIAIEGTVRRRPEGTENPDMATGAIEVLVTALQVLTRSDTPPIEVEDHDSAKLVHEELRMKYRYLDLRRPSMQRKIIMRHTATTAARDYMNANGFLEIETPILSKSTPEGARDYLVPSRVHHGHFYALPQSPQTWKQLLMVSGFDRYYQIARCFRDEDQRGDRQLEFTQIDLEMSFAEPEDIYDLGDGLMKALFKAVLDVAIETPVPRLSFKECVRRFGSDKPDLRYGLELVDVSDAVRDCEFKVFAGALAAGGRVVCLPIPGGAALSRTEIDGLAPKLAPFGAKGLAWMKVTDKGLESNIVKFFSEGIQAKIIAETNAKPGDLLTFMADRDKVVYQSLDFLRRHIARRLDLVDASKWSFLWVTDFPMFEADDDGNLAAAHHPFTNIAAEDVPLLETDPLKVRSRSFDMVLNGYELGSGSIRIHDRDLQSKVFRSLGIGEEEAQRKFGFLLEAFRYGAPPHAGFAFGMDRLMMLMAGAPNIREVICFPKTQKATCLLTDAPTEVDAAQLQELGLRIRKAQQ